MKRRLSRRERAAAVFLGVGVAAAVAGSLLLSGATHALLSGRRLPALLNSSPESLFVAYTGPRASLLPGRVAFETLHLRSRDSNVEWEARLEDVRVQFSLPALLSRRFHATSVRAGGLRFRLRERLTPREAAEGRGRGYPGVAGFPDPPLRDDQSRAESSGRPWRAAVDSLVVGRVAEIWIDGWRWEGDAGLSGGFRLDPGREAEVFTSELAIARGTLRFGKDTVSRAVAGRVRARIPHFATQEYPGNEIWKIVSGELALDASLSALPFLAGAGLPRVGVAPGTEGRFRVAGRLDGGAGAGELRASAQIVAAPDARTFRTRASVEARVDRLDFGAASLDGRVSGTLADGRLLVDLVPKGAPRWLASLPDLEGFVASARLRVRSSLLALTDVRASAAGVAAEADYRRKGGREWGALHVRKGSLSVATGLGPGAPGLKVLSASSWFREEARPGGLRTDQPRAAGSAPPLRETR